MTFRSQLQVVHGRLDPAPMVSVMFLLLIFVLLGSSFVLQPGIRVDLQTSSVRTPGVFQGMVVTVTRDDQVFFNDQRTSLDELGGRFIATTRARRQELIIKADRQVPHGVVVQIMTKALEAGVPSIQIATRPEPGEPRPGPEWPR